MTLSPERRARLGRWLLAGALVGLAIPGLRRGVRLADEAEGERVMCEGLPNYAGAVAALSESSRLRFWVDGADPRASERYFCAQLAVAPRLLVPPPVGRGERRSAARLAWTLVDGAHGPRLAVGDFAWRRIETGIGADSP
ncbi:MAG: hypothetical protein U0X73_04340 [Thermoanaerobaculia bacterium]